MTGSVGIPRWARGTLRVLSWVVPAGERAGWLGEWQGELEALAALRRTPGQSPPTMARFLAGAIPHAVSLRFLRRGTRAGGTFASALETVGQDLRFAIRALAHRPGYSLTAGATLALGIGASTALFTVVSRVLLAPSPFVDGERVVLLTESSVTNGLEDGSIAAATLFDLERDARTLSGLAGYQGGFDYIVDALDGGPPRLIPGARVLPGAFALLGVRAQRGRVFARDMAAVDPDGVVISHAVWRTVFQADTGVLGRPIEVGGRPATIVGVMPERVAFPDDRVGIWRPWIFSTAAQANRRSHLMRVVARLVPGVSLSDARTELTALMERYRAQYPSEVGDGRLRVTPWREAVLKDLKPTVLLLFGAVLVLLAIACLNVAGLGVIRSQRRAVEMTVRVALGAPRRRLLRIVVTENLLLAGLAALPGALLGWQGSGWLAQHSPVYLPGLEAVRFDPLVSAFVVLVTTLAGLVIALLPVIGTESVGMVERLKEGSRGATERRRWVLDGLVGAEVGLSVALLLGAGLLVRSYANLRSVDLGFSGANLTTLSVLPTQAKYPEVADQTVLYDRLLTEVAAIPGVRSAGVVTDLPLADPANTWSLLRPGRETEDDRIGVHWNPVSPGYFETVRLPLLRGRLPDDRDRAETTPVLVIDASAARHFFGAEEPIGAQVRTSPSSRWYTVIGVVGSVRHGSLRDDVQMTMYSPYAQNLETWRGARWLLVRTEDPRMDVASAIQAAVRRVDPGLMTDRLGPFSDRVLGSLAMDRFRLFVLGAFAGCALGLSVLGLYGTLTYWVLSRTPELAIRSAIGASPGTLVRGVVRRGLAITALGVLAGVFMAGLVGGVLRSVLFGVTILDPLTQVGVVVMVGGVALLAAWTPAARASRVAPAQALRGE